MGKLTREEIFEKHKETIYTSAFSSSCFGITSSVFPGSDIPLTITAWGTMIYKISCDAGRTMDMHTAGKLATSIAAGGGIYLGGCKLFAFSLHLIPGLGTLGSVVINIVLSALCTIRLGVFVAQRMENEEFNMEDWAILMTEVSAFVFAMPTHREVKDTFEAYQNYNNTSA